MFAEPNNDEINECIETMLCFGVVQSIDYENAEAIVKVADCLTAPIGWLMPSGNINSWIPPYVGSQVLLGCINGDLANAVILGCYAYNNFPPAGNTEEPVFKYKSTTIKISQNGDIEISSQGDININVPKINLTGDLIVTGKITASDDVKAGNISLKNHKHIGVKSGLEISGAAQ